MKSLFNKEDNREIVNRINSLTNGSKNQWGKMNVAQMLHHAQIPLQSAFGEIKLKRSLPGILFGGMVRKKLTRDEAPFSKELPTAKEFVTVDQFEFQKEKDALVKLVERFAVGGPDQITKDPHPFFGSMTAKEWDIIQWKHLDHHLRQFGA
jgi:hypothetical protein